MGRAIPLRSLQGHEAWNRENFTFLIKKSEIGKPDITDLHLHFHLEVEIYYFESQMFQRRL
jgi:hypothetical protein